ncbi:MULTISPECIES: tRNA pseudouridine(38-40) synthase TruA [Cytobacillus]|uniref:tRNA pseudouridine synthase A n=1 Tax=Cytobacillus kochii TaxID=859143 RepID=A0A248THE6_9BACI|nr:tRNA pseudouridine(38-40) synthase TruA [Cytobacillus kochii]ASV67618.1 tRNA pseudouridine(38-40) synthase TruA [Cytobacillus kochii]
MMRIKCIIAYDGTGFAGYQVQPNKRTVQRELESALTKLHKGSEVKVVASGRTDAGVHAVGQVIHFDSPLQLPEERWPAALNSILPNDVVVEEAAYVAEDFHARYHAIGKEYRYRLIRTKKSNPFLRHYAYQYSFPIDVERMREAIPYLLGEHDFTSFCSARSEVEDRVRNIYGIYIEEHDDELLFRFVGNGFLYNMIRILMGTLLEVGKGEREPHEIEKILAKKNRIYAGKTAPGHGLYLWQVYYEENIANDK